MNKCQLISSLTEYFTQRPDVCTAYLFGSVARGTSRSHSDVDLAVLFCDGLPLMERFEKKLELTNELEDLLKTQVDVVDLETVDPYFAHQVMLHKKLIVDKDVGRRVAFEVKSRKEFFDRQSFYDLYHQQALRRLEGEAKNGR